MMATTAAPFIRVSRKRTADPKSALMVCIKRGRLDGTNDVGDPLLFSLCATQDSPHLPVDIKIIDYKGAPVAQPNFSDLLVQQVDETEQPLAQFGDAVGEIGDFRVDRPKASADVITCNGRPMMKLIPNESDIVYDFYEIKKGEIRAAIDEADFEMRFMSQEEFNLWMDSGSDSEECADDDEDSNDENHWGNDYPEEESGSGEDDDTYSEGDSRDEDDVIGMRNLRLDESDPDFGEYGSEGDEDEAEAAG
ncbi:unnamed protein product, partial [Mesorhabditis spiculigera]